MSKPLPNAITIANKTSDYVVFGIAVGVLLLPLLISFIFVPEQWIYGVVLVVAVIVIMIMVRVMQIQLMSNSLRIQNSQYAHFKKDISEISQALGVPPVDVHVVQDPYLNAFAIGIANPYAIVLHSATMEQLSYEEMRAIFIHEIGHVRYKHTILTVYVSALSLVPILGPAVSWIFGFWSRRAEYTSDRLATAFTGDPDLVINALIKIHAGPFAGNKTSKEYLMYQDAVSQNWLRKFSQTFSSHPYLVNRVKHILRFADEHGYQMSDDLRNYVRSRPHS